MCASAVAGASPPPATSAPTAPTPPSPARWPSPRRSPRPRPGRWRRSPPRAATGPHRTSSTRSTSRSRTSSSTCSRPRPPCAPATSASSAPSPGSAPGATARRLASTEGAACTQELVATGGGIAAFATDGSELQVRSYPLSHGGLFAAAGWEHVLALDLAGHAPRVAQEALELLDAPACPEGVTTVVLDGEQLALQIHESIGHALELDRILLGEASYAGHELGRPGRPRVAALRLGGAHDRGRRHHPGRARLVRMGRRGRARAPLPAHRRGRAARRAVQPRVGGVDRPGRVGRLRARRRLRRASRSCG